MYAKILDHLTRDITILLLKTKKKESLFLTPRDFLYRHLRFLVREYVLTRYRMFYLYLIVPFILDMFAMIILL